MRLLRGWVNSGRRATAIAAVAAAMLCAGGQRAAARSAKEAAPKAAAAGSSRPLETALIGALDGSRAKVGAPVLLRVLMGWSEPGCALQPGSIVQGRVVAVQKRSKVERNGTMQVTFHAADCDGHPETPRGFELVALVGGLGQDINADGLVASPPLANAVGIGIGSSSAGGGTGAMRSVGAASAASFTPSRPAQVIPASIAPGAVLGIAKTTLHLCAASDGVSEIAGVGHDPRLESGTIVVLLRRAEVARVADTPPASGSEARVSGVAVGGEGIASETAVGAAPLAVAASVAPAEPPDETEVCSGVCTLVEHGSATRELMTSTANATLPMRTLGFVPHERHRAASFDDETTLSYLDAHHLLCTFDPHRLRERTGRDDEAVRVVRAVLIDPATHAVRRVLDWRVRGDEQYLWLVPGGRVMVHMGHELRLFDAELKPQRALPVNGRVAWVAVSPVGDHFAVGTVREMHSETEHRQLEDVLAMEPEESVEVRVLDGELRTLFATTRSSRSPAPVLTEDGELRLRDAGAHRWAISQYGWDQRERPVATTRSFCQPMLSAPGRGLIFAVGCTVSGGRWYRMLRPDGHALLKGESPSDEIEQTARASAAGVFAVRVIKASRAMSPGQPFSRADLAREEVGVYRSTDGGTVEAIATEDFAPSEEAFAISPTGEQIALVGRDAIRFYAVRR